MESAKERIELVGAGGKDSLISMPRSNDFVEEGREKEVFAERY